MYCDGTPWTTHKWSYKGFTETSRPSKINSTYFPATSSCSGLLQTWPLSEKREDVEVEDGGEGVKGMDEDKAWIGKRKMRRGGNEKRKPLISVTHVSLSRRRHNSFHSLKHVIFFCKFEFCVYPHNKWLYWDDVHQKVQLERRPFDDRDWDEWLSEPVIDPSQFISWKKW